MTAKKDIFNIQSTPIGWDINIDKELKAYYTHQKQEYLRKYNLTELKQGKTKTAIESWNS
jgi:peptide subunit release factor RF-3